MTPPPFPLFTSIRPPAAADELANLRDCLASWRSAGFYPIAVNGPIEIEALRCPETRKELGIADAFEPFVAFTLGYAASIPPSRPRERPEIVWLDDRT